PVGDAGPGLRVLDRRLRVPRLRRGTDPAVRTRGPGIRARPRAVRGPPAAPPQVPDPTHDAASVGPQHRQDIRISPSPPPPSPGAPRRRTRPPGKRRAPG